ncbi:amino acid/amide ABC transporter ATP-binding protein 1 (HAAT family) [Halohasta litchfieldiae]|jgi:branched-chain amino acid transport system ATP-binding protein|uniref:Amino acid/amide ABC transporter ATP-binding protein 1, HAAT family n=1 Tax=Halohasta litchfieldiae TaxID=1073996 RepID=A0A1H6UBZ0_9EURY|nr:ABC transporter ATP-binding protein [Halohasta litchfieldiae]ATW87428.1 amino acid/amide ABC transporter ATP-binding protein 1 (HAAT family) [Halohasta litchfieldiae]SEI89831.1 amino acid/amide ABC transporter ATP-binding protein 1, HAAT family [Halohasta litchfieldiae]
MSAPEDINARQKPAVATTGSGTNVILATRQLTKKFGGLTAVDDVDFEVNRGEIRCLIGPNGAGKSTLLNLITGKLSPSEGDIYFDGNDLTGLDPHERIDTGLSVKFQSPHVYENLSVKRNLQVPLQRTDRNVDRVMAETLEQIALTEQADTPAGDLSHGQQQRLEIGMAITLDPELMLLDEPVAGMSVDETADVADLITSLHDDGMAFLVVEHDMEFVREISEQVTVLNQGAVFRQGPIEEIETDEAVRRIYLGENA